MTFLTTPLKGEVDLLESMPRAQGTDEPFRIEVSGASQEDESAFTPNSAHPAAIEQEADRLVLSHPLFRAEIDPVSKFARLHRTGGLGLSLSQTIRAALLSVLPHTGGLAVHSCAAAGASGALVFYGRSGAGKTTLAMTAPWPLLSDELVVLRRGTGGWNALPSGFWGGARGRDRFESGWSPLRALIALQKGASFRIETLTLSETRRGVVASLHVPPLRQLWELTLPLVDNLVTSVPGFSMAWHPSDPPWERLRAILESDTGQT